MPPRGGRGGGGAGRARPAAGKVRIGGIDIEYDEETQSEAQNRPQAALVFPPYEVTAAREITPNERAEVAHYREIRDRIRRGPLYTTLEGAANLEARGMKRKPVTTKFDAFNGMQTYSMRYEAKRKGNAPLHSRSFVLKFFPPELHSILDPSARVAKSSAPRRRKEVQTDLDEAAIDSDGGEEGGKAEDDDEGAVRRVAEDGDEPAEEVVEDDFTEDEDDDGHDDYNAEQYFDDGEGGDDDLDGGNEDTEM